MEDVSPLLRLGLLLHVGAQHRVHAALIAFALALEEVEHVLVDADRDRFLLAGITRTAFDQSMSLEFVPIRIAGDRGLDFLVGHRDRRASNQSCPCGDRPIFALRYVLSSSFLARRAEMIRISFFSSSDDHCDQAVVQRTYGNPALLDCSGLTGTA